MSATSRNENDGTRKQTSIAGTGMIGREKNQPIRIVGTGMVGREKTNQYE
jgi:hypothetical protein